MEKGINLQAKLHAGSDADAIANLEKALPGAFSKANPGLTLAVKHVSDPDEKGNVTLKVYIEGDEDPASDFAALTHNALNKAISSMNATAVKGAGLQAGSGSQQHIHVAHVEETEGADQNTDVTLPPSHRPASRAQTAAPSTPQQSAQPTSPAEAAVETSASAGSAPSAASVAASAASAASAVASSASQPPSPSQAAQAVAQPTAHQAPDAPTTPPQSAIPNPQIAKQAPWWAFWRRGN